MIWSRAAAAAALCLLSTLSQAQDRFGEKDFEKWTLLSSREAGLVIILDAKIESFVLADEKGDKLDASRWTLGVPFVRQYRVIPGVYQIRLTGPLDGASIRVQEGRLTYLQLSSYGEAFGLDGLRLTVWTGVAPAHIKNLVLNSAAKVPEILNVQRIDSSSKVFYISTDPPWPVPPPPKR